jgi:hypothetical protein
MFFRRQRPKVVTFEERLESLKAWGFTVSPQQGNRYRVERDGCAAVFERGPGEAVRVVERPGILIGSEIAGLIDGGYQKFFQTPGGARKPALAEDLTRIHSFQEDLREGLGMISLYNESLGTVSQYYLYDRVENRDRGGPKRPWESAGN